MKTQELTLNGEFMNNASEAIANLRLMSSELERLSNEPRNYNTAYACYLEQLSHELYRSSNELKCLVSCHGDV